MTRTRRPRADAGLPRPDRRRFRPDRRVAEYRDEIQKSHDHVWEARRGMDRIDKMNAPIGRSDDALLRHPARAAREAEEAEQVALCERRGRRSAWRRWRARSWATGCGSSGPSNGRRSCSRPTTRTSRSASFEGSPDFPRQTEAYARRLEEISFIAEDWTVRRRPVPAFVFDEAGPATRRRTGASVRRLSRFSTRPTCGRWMPWATTSTSSASGTGRF